MSREPACALAETEPPPFTDKDTFCEMDSSSEPDASTESPFETDFIIALKGNRANISFCAPGRSFKLDGAYITAAARLKNAANRNITEEIITNFLGFIKNAFRRGGLFLFFFVNIAARPLRLKSINCFLINQLLFNQLTAF